MRPPYVPAKPSYIQSLPDEIKRYGFAGAGVLAHIRFRCNGPDAIERGGFRWWRVSHRDLGFEVGASPEVVKGALRKLGGAVVSANNSDDPRDQTRAYRPADYPADIDASTFQNVVSPRSEALDGFSTPDLGESTSVPMSNDLGTGVKPPTALPTEEPKEEKQEPPSPPTAEASPTHTDDSANEAREQSNIPEVIDAEIVPEERGQERGRSNPVDVSASRLVSMLVPANTPAAVKTALRLKASELIRGDGVPSEVVAEALRRWQARPDAGVGLLPYIASEVLREGTAPARLGKIESWARFTESLPDAGQREGTSPAPQSKARTVAEWALEARQAEQRHSPGARPRSKLRDWYEFAESIPDDEQRADAEEPEQGPPPPAIEAKAAPNPKPTPPPWLPGPNGEPRCRVHAHLPATPPDCAGCRAAAEIAAGEAS